MRIEMWNDNIRINCDISVHNDGRKYSYNKYGYSHEVDGPAREYNDGGEIWYSEGLLYRPDGPSVEFSNDTWRYKR